MKIKKLSTRLLVALLSFTAGVAVTLQWLSTRVQTVSTPSTLAAPSPSPDEGPSWPEGWREIEVKNKVTMRVPQDMKPGRPIGDSLSHTEGYGNGDISIIIIYGDPTTCDAAPFFLERSTYQESVIDIGGRKVKVGVDRYHQPEFITARACFLDADDNAKQLKVSAFCKDERALETAQQIFASIRFKDSR